MSEYFVNKDKIMKVTVEVDLNDVMNKIDNPGAGRFEADLPTIIRHKVAEKIVDKFLLEHTQDVMQMIDPKHVANLVAMKASKELRQ